MSVFEQFTEATEVEAAFAPNVSVHDVDELTLGRQQFNDSDKSNYFEG